jgi:hypothetical protein
MTEHTYESIQFLKSTLTKAEFIGFCKGQIIHIMKTGNSLKLFEQAKLFQDQLVKEFLPSDYGVYKRNDKALVNSAT